MACLSEECCAGIILWCNLDYKTLYDAHVDNHEKQILYDENWEKLIENANQELLSEWKFSDSPLESDLKHNLDKWGNTRKLPLMIKNDSIFYQIYYSEKVFDMLISLEDLKERINDVLLYTKPYNAVRTLFMTMAQNQKVLYVLLISNKKQRFHVIPFNANEYKLFGSKIE